MSEGRIETTKGMCVIALTKFLMKRFQIEQDKAYAKLLETELYSLLTDSETRLFLETNEYLCKCCAIELDDGSDALYHFINDEGDAV